MTTKINLVGVLELASKYRYGISSHGTPLYLFCPYETSSKAGGYGSSCSARETDAATPQFIVGSKHRDLSVNQIAIVEVPFPYEMPPAPAKPRGNLVHLIGAVGDIDYERTALIYHYCPYRAVASLPQCLSSYSDDWARRDADRTEISKLTGWHTFHVDPPGCRDIDDAIAFHPATGQWAITIADVAAAVPVGCDVDIRARMLGATFYDPDGSVGLPMLPPALSEDSASLLPGHRRRGVSLIWKPATPEEFLRLGDTEEPVFVSSWINVEHSFTYESFTASVFARETLGIYCEVPSDRQLPYARQIDLSAPDAIASVSTSGHLPSHDWIANLMIRYNAAAARVLKSRSAGILRVQSPAAAEKVAAWPASLRHLANEAAVYVSAADASEGHASLGLAAYTHASSPLRRYADLINQRVLVGLSSEATATAVVDNLNQRAKAIKRLGRDMTFLTYVTPGRVHEVDVVWINKEADCSAGGQADGKEADADSERWKVWVPTWQRTLRLRHVPTTPGEPGTAGRIAVYCDPTRRNWKQRILTADIAT